MSDEEYTLRSLRALAEFRYLLRCFLVQSDVDARSLALEPQQYLLLLHLGAHPEGVIPDVRYVADRLKIKHHSAVELIDRAVVSGLVCRSESLHDLRKKVITLTPKGQQMINVLASIRLKELSQSGPELVQALENVLDSLPGNGAR